MAYGIVHQFPGGTQEQYEASIAVVHPSDGSLPEGQLFHAAGPSSEGWTIVAVHDSQESWERFRDEILMPSLSRASNTRASPGREDLDVSATAKANIPSRWWTQSAPHSS